MYDCPRCGKEVESGSNMDLCNACKKELKDGLVQTLKSEIKKPKPIQMADIDKMVEELNIPGYTSTFTDDEYINTVENENKQLKSENILLKSENANLRSEITVLQSIHRDERRY